VHRCALLLLALAAGPTIAHAHTFEMLGGRLEASSDGEVTLTLPVRGDRLARLAGYGIADWRNFGEVITHADALAACFQTALVIRAGEREWHPDAVFLPALLGDAPPPATEPLPEFVTVVARWDHAPEGGRVRAHFDLPETYVVLTLENNPDAIVTWSDSDKESSTQAMAASSESWGRTVGRALVIGFEHIVPRGLDHILFVLGLYFAARRRRDLLWQITAFTVAHSLTLGLAMTGVVVLSATWARVVEIGIAVSIVAVAAEACLAHDGGNLRRTTIVACFGLVHGLGFAGALSEVQWPGSRFIPALLSANLGIELGQLAVVVGALLLTAWWWKRSWYRGRVAVPASVAIGLCGLFWAVERTAGVWQT
jgi:hydrogenase/urease accessory protein HupE